MITLTAPPDTCCSVKVNIGSLCFVRSEILNIHALNQADFSNKNKYSLANSKLQFYMLNYCITHINCKLAPAFDLQGFQLKLFCIQDLLVTVNHHAGKNKC